MIALDDSALRIEFDNGAEFDVPFSDKFIREDVMKIVSGVDDFCKKHNDDDKAIANKMLDAIDIILGAGASGKIFTGKNMSACLVLQAYTAILREITQQYQDRVVKLSDTNGPYAQNTEKEHEHSAGILKANIAPINAPRL